MSCAFAAVLWALLPAQGGPEERIDDTDYERYAAAQVKAVEAIGKTWKKDPAAALKAIEPVLGAVEATLAPRLPRLIEATIAVRITRGIDKGEVKDRHAFFPYRLAGEIALAAGEPERAVRYLEKSPTGAALLDQAKKAVAAKEKPGPAPPPPLPPPPPGPAPAPPVDPKPFLDRLDFSGALDALRAAPGPAGFDADPAAQEVRRLAVRHQKAATAQLAGVLPRLDQPGFRTDHLDPCLQACARIPADLESDELRWARRLDRWIEKRDPAEFERLALAAARFGGDFQVLCDRAQDARLAEIERLVGAVGQAERAERPGLLDRLGQAERAYLELAAAHERPELQGKLAGLKARLPIDDQALDQARSGVSTIAGIRRLADELDRLWASDRRARLSLPDQKDLAIHLGVYRCLALFLDGKSVEEASRDVRIIEVFRIPGELPKNLSPKVAAVRARIKP